MTAIKWLFDFIFLHIYLYKEPPAYWKADQWKSMQGLGKPQPVTKKKCRVCQRTVWTNNPKSICGSLQCWLKGA